MPSLEVLEARVVPAGVHVIEPPVGSPSNDPQGANFGQSMASGDFNGDGFLDLIVGTGGGSGYGPVATPTGGTGAYVYFGNGKDFSLEKGVLNGENGFLIELTDEFENTLLNLSVASAGDVNGDGIDDMLIAVGSDVTTSPLPSGSFFVVFGKSDPFSSIVDLKTLDGTDGFKFTGTGTGSYFNPLTSISSGDFNGDGYSDILAADVILFGHSGTFAAELSAPDLDGSNGTVFTVGDVEDRLTGAPTSLGDVNGDGIDDFAVPVLRESNMDFYHLSLERHVVVYGKQTWSTQTDVSNADGASGFVISASQKYPGQLLRAGDINGDGIGDILFGVYGDFDSQDRSTKIGVIFGSADFGSTFSISSIDGTNGFIIADSSDQVRLLMLAPVGDFNGDGFDDIAIRGITNDQPAGTFTYIFYGSEEPASARIDFTKLDQKDGLMIPTKDQPFLYNQYAAPVVALGDWDGDGMDDFVIADRVTYSPTNIQSTLNFFGGTTSVDNDSILTISKDGRTATYIDVDGDKVTLKTKGGDFRLADFTFAAEGKGWKLVELDVDETAWATGADLSITAARSKADGGDGLVNITSLKADGLDLGKVIIDGNLERISAGDADLTTAAIASLRVQSLGGKAGEAIPESHITGTLERLVIKEFVQSITLNATALGKIDIGEVRDAGTTSFLSDSTIESLKVRGDSQALKVQAFDLERTSTAKAQAIGKIQIKGDANDTHIYAGDVEWDNWNAHIGLIKVGGAWVGSSVQGKLGPKSDNLS